MNKKKIILRNSFSPGDVVLLTAAVRDLHLCYPGRFVTDVRTPYPELWEHNPYLGRLDENADDVEVIECDYPLINHCNETPYHAIHGFMDFLNQRLGLNIKPTAFKGDIHLSAEEKKWASQVHELTGEDTPFWIIVAGGKPDITIKWWDAQRYQAIVDHFKEKILFVQVGAANHDHPRLKGVFDFRGKTDLRQLLRLVYHAQGVLCPVTLLMHLAAAVEVKGGVPKNRPCVVVAGGREPAHWEAYPHHQFIHTNGSLLCCDNGGCWKSRTVPLQDGDERDRPENLCVNVVGQLPKCMDMITADEVINRIEGYFDGGAAQYLNSANTGSPSAVVAFGESINWEPADIDRYAYKNLILESARSGYLRATANKTQISTDNVVVMSTYRRDKYLQRTLDALKRNNYSNYSLVIGMEPGFPKVEAVIENTNWIEKYVIKNQTRMLNRWNLLHVIETAVLHGAQNIFCLEDDVLLSPDALDLANWFFSLKDKDYLCLCLLNYRSDPSHPEDIREVGAFVPYGWCATADAWMRHFRPSWMCDPRGWDRSVNEYLRPRRGVKILQPTLSRSNHIGREQGERCTVAYYDKTFRQLQISDGSVRHYSIRKNT